MVSQTKENYLKAVYFLAEKKEKISLSDLSHEMQVSSPTANSMVKKMQDEGWVKYEKYRPLQLTASGKKAAALIIRKHRLTEMFLVEKMNFGWEEVHDIAEEIEHVNSVALFERMDEMLNHPTIDPHGSPIPNKNGEVAKNNYRPLSEISATKKVKLRALTSSSQDFLIFLNKKNLSLNIEFTVEQIEPFDNSMQVKVGRKPVITLSSEVCERLLVEVV